jgi:hypothetical protein
MRDEGIRLLMVTDTDGTIVGKITAMEIQGQKPIEMGATRRPRTKGAEILAKSG